MKETEEIAMKYSGAMVGSSNPKALGEFYAKVLGKPGMQEAIGMDGLTGCS